MTLDVGALRAELEEVAVVDDAGPMSAYMRNQFPFLGVKTPALRAVLKPFLTSAREATAADLIAFADGCWDEDEREFQYAATIMLRRWIKTLAADDLDHLRRYITTKSWWDTIDGLAAWSVGPLVAANPELAATMDEWIEHDDFWLARTAILHQLSYKDDTDGERLFAYCLRRSGDTEFFIRKAIGWALRQYARQEPDDVRAFVAEHEHRLSGLTKREALKHIGPA